MHKEIKIGETAVMFNATAATPLYYRDIFQRDMLVDMGALDYTNGQLSDGSAETLTRAAYAMAADYADEHGETIEEPRKWLRQFGMLDILNASREISALWHASEKTTRTGKKK